MINDHFGFLSGFIQEVEVRGIFDIGGHAGGIDEQLAFRENGLGFPLLFDQAIFCL